MAVKRQSVAAKHRRFLREAAKGYDELLAAQGGHCALCPAVAKTRKLHIDHDHKRMVTRGLLCFNCNAQLRARMTPAWLRAAANYLERAESTT